MTLPSYISSYAADINSAGRRFNLYQLYLSKYQKDRLLAMSLSEERFLELIQTNPFNKHLLERLPELGAPQSFLVAGCLFQTLWNVQADRPTSANIRDYDVFYFDKADLSYEAENVVIQAAKDLFADLDITVQVRNQARVHLWYK